MQAAGLRQPNIRDHEGGSQKLHNSLDSSQCNTFSTAFPRSALLDAWRPKERRDPPLFFIKLFLSVAGSQHIDWAGRNK